MTLTPNRLNRILKSSDKHRISIIEREINDVPIDLMLSLGSGDLLFIDSSHVVKCGSDLQTIMFEILPNLPPGIFVHFHDIIYPFDYPSEWLKEGRYWNESYFLRAFLSYNHEWRVYYYNSYVVGMFHEYIKTKMPLCLKNSGGSLYIQRKEKA